MLLVIHSSKDPLLRTISESKKPNWKKILPRKIMSELKKHEVELKRYLKLDKNSRNKN